MGEGARKREKRGGVEDEVGGKRGVRGELEAQANSRCNRDGEQQASADDGEADASNDTDMLINFQEACRRYSRRCGLSCGSLNADIIARHDSDHVRRDWLFCLSQDALPRSLDGSCRDHCALSVQRIEHAKKDATVRARAGSAIEKLTPRGDRVALDAFKNLAKNKSTDMAVIGLRGMRKTAHREDESVIEIFLEHLESDEEQVVVVAPCILLFASFKETLQAAVKGLQNVMREPNAKASDDGNFHDGVFPSLDTSSHSSALDRRRRMKFMILPRKMQSFVLYLTCHERMIPKWSRP
eukprot:764151-Hanusia_phi.AAC.13